MIVDVFRGRRLPVPLAYLLAPLLALAYGIALALFGPGAGDDC